MNFHPLQRGDLIRLVAPSSPFDGEKLDRAVQIFEDSGYRVTFARHVFDRNGYLAGTDHDRARDLVDALSDPDNAAVLCIRGGYGSGRLLPHLPFSSLRRNRPIFIGHSDITFLHLAFHCHMEWVTFHGPNLTGLGDFPHNAIHLLDTLSGTNPFSWELEERQILRHGISSGKVLGGNLTCMMHLLGTPFFPDLDGALLLVEDRGEALYRLDRLFMQLRLSGILYRLGGLILGSFQDCAEFDRICDMVMEHAGPLDFPVVAGLPFGHGIENHVIPLGTPFLLNTYEHILRPFQHPFAAHA